MIVLFISAVLLFGSNVSEQASSGSDGIDYRLLYQKKASPFDNNCVSNGDPVCKTCTQLGTCQWNGENSEWEIKDAGNCETGESCFNGLCMTTENPTCPPISGFDFMCTATGMFPDQGDCKTYHHCTKDTDTSPSFNWYDEKCKGEYAYNSKTTYCDKKLGTAGCTAYPVPMCKKTGESGALKENPTIYYVCIKHPNPPAEQTEVLYPSLRVCPHGKTFNPTTRVCNT